jgi:hypothetical protein
LASLGGAILVPEITFSLFSPISLILLAKQDLSSTGWRNIVKAMLENIRVICLLEAVLNLSLGILWGRRLVTQGENLMAFGDDQ